MINVPFSTKKPNIINRFIGRDKIMFNAFRKICSKVYSSTNSNAFKTIMVSFIDMLSTGINLVAPLLLADNIAKKFHEKSETTNPIIQNELSAEDITIIVAGSALFVSKFLPRIRNFLVDSIRSNVQKELAKDLVAKIFELELDQHLTEPTGSFNLAFSKNYSSVEKVIPAFWGEILPFSIDTIAISSYMISRTYIGFTPLGFTLLYILSALLLERKGIQIRAESVVEGYKSYGVIAEAISNYQIAHYFGNVAYELEKVESGLKASENKNKKVHYNDDINALLLTFINNLGLASSILLQIFFAPNLEMKEIVLFGYYLMYLYSKIDTLPNAFSSFYGGIADARSIMKLLDRPSLVANVSNAVVLNSKTPLEIEFRKVSFSYKDKFILDNISFKIEKGQKLAIVGATGVGKSTIIKLLLRFYKPLRGKILVNNIDINKYTIESLRQHFAVVSQESILFHSSIKENIRYGDRDADLRDIQNAARFAELDKSIDSEEEKKFDSISSYSGQELISLEGSNVKHILEREVGQGGGKLSGGEKQRVIIARAFLKGGKALILDEPTSSLDLKTENEVQQTLDTITFSGGVTTLLVTHRLNTVVNADSILFLKNGIIQEKGSFEELLQLRGEFYEQLAVQCQQLGLEIDAVKTGKSKPLKNNLLASFWNRRKTTPQVVIQNIDADEADPLLLHRRSVNSEEFNPSLH